jgi:protein O-GlcNAc transferase
MNRRQRRAAASQASGSFGNPPARYALDTDVLFDAAHDHFKSGKIGKAEKLSRAICAADPDHAGATHLLGLIAHQRGGIDEAVSLMKRAIGLNPKFAFAHNNLGVMLCQMGNFDAGISSYKKAIALKPDYAVALNNLGAALTNNNRPDEAVVQCGVAVRFAPRYPEAHYNLASALHLLGRSAESIAHFERALELNPNYADAQFALCMAELPILFRNEAEIGTKRTAYERRLRALKDKNLPGADLAGAVGSAQPFQLAYQGYNDRELQSLYGSFICRLMAGRYPPVELPPFATGEELVRVGVVSGYFRQHSNWKIPIKGWISQLNRSRFKVFGYHTGVIRDKETAAAEKLCDRFVQGPLSIEDWRREILADRPHVLIYPEVGMNPVAVKLAAQRLAPVQCNSWGHPETSGFPTLDYYLSSELMEPSNGETHYSENLICLPNLSIFYEPSTIQPASTSRSDLRLRSSATVFWCGQSLFKYLPQFDQIFPRIASEVTDCQFVFIHFPPGENIKELFYQRLNRSFREYGLKVEEHCIILPKLDDRLFSAVMGQCDIVLDSLGWSGCNSTLESLQYDLPIVTMPGPLMRGRHTMAILTMMGIPQTIAYTIEEYIEIAVRLAKDRSWRSEIKEAVSRTKHRLYYDRACVLKLEEVLICVAQGRQIGKVGN